MATDLRTWRPGLTQSAAYTSNHGVISTAFAAGTRTVRVVVTSAAHIAIGASPTATTTTDMYIPANVPEHIHVNPGEKVSAVMNASSGVVYVTEVS